MSFAGWAKLVYRETLWRDYINKRNLGRGFFFLRYNFLTNEAVR